MHPVFFFFQIYEWKKRNRKIIIIIIINIMKDEKIINGILKALYYDIDYYYINTIFDKCSRYNNVHMWNVA